MVLPSLPVALPSLRCTDSVDLFLFVSMFFLGAESGPMAWITLPEMATSELGTVEEHTLFLCVLSWTCKIWSQCCFILVIGVFKVCFFEAMIFTLQESCKERGHSDVPTPLQPGGGMHL